MKHLRTFSAGTENCSFRVLTPLILTRFVNYVKAFCPGGENFFGNSFVMYQMLQRVLTLRKPRYDFFTRNHIEIE